MACPKNKGKDHRIDWPNAVRVGSTPKHPGQVTWKGTCRDCQREIEIKVGTTLNDEIRSDRKEEQKKERRGSR